jgi:hypothetical protein
MNADPLHFSSLSSPALSSPQAARETEERGRGLLSGTRQTLASAYEGVKARVEGAVEAVEEKMGIFAPPAAEESHVGGHVAGGGRQGHVGESGAYQEGYRKAEGAVETVKDTAQVRRGNEGGGREACAPGAPPNPSISTPLNDSVYSLPLYYRVMI